MRDLFSKVHSCTSVLCLSYSCQDEKTLIVLQLVLMTRPVGISLKNTNKEMQEKDVYTVAWWTLVFTQKCSCEVSWLTVAMCNSSKVIERIILGVQNL